MKNKRIRRLTPATLKRIIAEEKYKINRDKKLDKSKKVRLVEAYVKCLRLLKETNHKKSKELKKINELEKLLRKKLARSL